MSGKCVVIKTGGEATVHDWEGTNDQINDLMGLGSDQYWEHGCARNHAGSYFVEETSMVRLDTVFNGYADLAWLVINSKLAPWPMFGTVLIAGPVVGDDVSGLDDIVADGYRRAAALWGSVTCQGLTTCGRCNKFVAYSIASRLGGKCRDCFVAGGPVTVTELSPGVIYLASDGE